MPMHCRIKSRAAAAVRVIMEIDRVRSERVCDRTTYAVSAVCSTVAHALSRNRRRNSCRILASWESDHFRSAAADVPLRSIVTC